jgi:transcriptional regulator with XRE-family HTH domain
VDLKRGAAARARFVELYLNKFLAFQIRAMRDREQWNQQDLADRIGTNQNGVSRLENPFYGKATLTTLKRVATAFDVALIVRFVPFSQLADWVSGIHHTDMGLTETSFAVPSFALENPDVTKNLGNVPSEEREVAQSEDRPGPMNYKKREGALSAVAAE